MPRASQAAPESRLAKLLLIGDGKIGKSFYAALAARKFNVLYLDGDVASQTIAQTPMEVQENIFLMDVGDKTTQGALTHDFIDFMVEFTTASKVLWDDTKLGIIGRSSDTSDSEVWTLYPGRLDSNWVLIIDSWTSLVQSAMLRAARANGVDLADASLSQMREVYKGAGMNMSQLLVVIQRIKCHVICIAHPDEFVKYERPEGQRVNNIKEGDLKVLWTKMVPKSTSRPHALTMAKHFTDVAWMESNRAGTERQLDFKLSIERVSGGHLEGRESMEKYSFEHLVKALGGAIPASHPEVGGPDSPIEIHARGTWERPGAAKVLQASQKSAVPAADAPKAAAAPRGLAALIGGNKGN